MKCVQSSKVGVMAVWVRWDGGQRRSGDSISVKTESQQWRCSTRKISMWRISYIKLDAGEFFKAFQHVDPVLGYRNSDTEGGLLNDFSLYL